MPIFQLGDDLAFPDPNLAHRSGVLAVGGDLSVDRLLVAYSMGIFPWPAEGYPLLWHAPPERFILEPTQLQVNRTLAKVLRRHPYEIRLDSDFDAVMQRCASVPRPGQDGTWIFPEVIEAYTTLHRLGFAHSAEAWHDGELVGGLYGVALGKAFFGESMFALQPNASKVAFATLVEQLRRWGFHFVDAQVHTALLESLGCHFVPRRAFGQLVARAVAEPGVPAPWRLDSDLQRGWAPQPAPP
jgi:leucyl/phenylalanyl-tRNA--protein transferase